MSARKQLNKNQLFKRQKIRNARTIRTEASDAGSKNGDELSETGGMLKVPQFMVSREFEVKQLQIAIHKSKQSSSTRVFQSLPRNLRRRTASHNVKRIPKRMRNRALREMLKSEQSITKGTKDLSRKRKHGLNARQLYRARMSVKLLRLAARSTSLKLALPSQATASKCKLRTRIKALQKQIREHKNHSVVTVRNNQMGSYDNTGINQLAPKPVGRIKYTKRQRLFTWLPTHVWNAKRSHMCKRWGYQIPFSPTQKCFKLTHRIGGNVASSDGSLCFDTSYIGTAVVSATDPTLLKELVAKMTRDRGSLKKYSQSQHLYEGLFYNADSVLGPGTLLWVSQTKIILRLHPVIYHQVFGMLLAEDTDIFTVQDCRYSIGSITLTGAKSLQALSMVTRGVNRSRSYEQFKSVCSITDVNTLPQRTIFAFNAIDPRHLINPRKLKAEAPNVHEILQLQEDYPRDEISAILQGLSEPRSREKSYENQQTLKQLAFRRRKLLDTPNVGNLIPHENGDPEIPVVIAKQPRTGSWILLLPWYWVLPFWYQLNRVSRVYHAGIKQQHQLNYEAGRLQFPEDYPFTTVGHGENAVYKRLASKTLWERKPPAKKVNFAKIPRVHAIEPPTCKGEIGDWFSCDWRLLQILRNGIAHLNQKGVALKMCDPSRTTQYEQSLLRDLNYVNDLIELYMDVKDKPTDENLPISLVNQNLEKYDISNRVFEAPAQQGIVSTPLSVIAVVCTLAERGHPKDNARVYSIPKRDMEYWLSIAHGTYRSNGKRDHDTIQPLPPVENLIGFITSATFHLGEGTGRCNGFIDAYEAAQMNHKYVLIRNVGTNVYRLAEWKQIVL